MRFSSTNNKEEVVETSLTFADTPAAELSHQSGTPRTWLSRAGRQLALQRIVAEITKTFEGVDSRPDSMLLLLEEDVSAARVDCVYPLLSLGCQERPEDKASEFRQRLVDIQVPPSQLETSRHHVIPDAVLPRAHKTHDNTVVRARQPVGPVNVTRIDAESGHAPIQRRHYK